MPVGISLHPQSTGTTRSTLTGTTLDTARLDALTRSNRGLRRTSAPGRSTPPAPTAQPTHRAVTKPPPLPRIAGLNATQVANAWAVVAEGHRMGISLRGQTIAMATALQESRLVNYRHAVDHDSLGIFQQRPSSGWGQPSRLTDPTYAAHAFYRALVRYRSLWGCLTCSAQHVQRSAYPNAYAKHEANARRIVEILNRRF